MEESKAGNPGMSLNGSSNFESVQEVVRYAYQNVRLFKQQMLNFGLHPSDIESISDFARLPITDKNLVRTNFPAGVLANGYTMKDPSLVAFNSSGSTGERTITLEKMEIVIRRWISLFDIYPELHSHFFQRPDKKPRICFLGPPNCSDVDCANPNSTMEQRTQHGSFHSLQLAVSHDLLTTPEHLTAQSIEEIKQFKPRLYFVDPTHFAFLIRRCEALNLTIPAAPILTLFTARTLTSLRQIQNHFPPGNICVETAGMSETQSFAMDCSSGHMHLNTNSFFFELLTNGQPAQPNQLAELYITTLEKGCSPHIRYRTGDVFCLTGHQCDCGSSLPVVRIEGRIRNCLFTDGEIGLTPKQLDDLIGRAEWLALYKMEQLAPNSFQFRFIPTEQYNNGDENYIAEELERCLGTGIELKMERANYIPAERSGKFLSCISRVGDEYTQKGYRL